jgi:hypothetical protein
MKYMKLQEASVVALTRLVGAVEARAWPITSASQAAGSEGCKAFCRPAEEL